MYFYEYKNGYYDYICGYWDPPIIGFYNYLYGWLDSEEDLYYYAL